MTTRNSSKFSAVGSKLGFSSTRFSQIGTRDSTWLGDGKIQSYTTTSQGNVVTKPRRITLEIDFDRSTADFRMRYSSVDSTDIQPRLSIGSRNEEQAGKRVVFVIHEDVDKSDDTRTMRDSWTASSLPKLITEDSVKYSLEHKFVPKSEDIFSSVSGSKSNIVSHQESFLFDERFQARESKDIEHAEDVYFTGGMKQTEPAILDQKRFPQKHRRINSQDVIIGNSVSFLASELWPWPWLNPEMKARDIYRNRTRDRVTFENQNNLPTLPVPILGHSLNRYLQTLRPCITASQHEVIEKIIETFAVKEGKLCHQKFVETVVPEKDWIKQFLPNYSHCFSRQEAMLLNTAIVAPFMHDLWPEKPDSQLERAALLVEISLEFWSLIWAERLLPISDENGNKICMHQFRKIFSSAKIPGIPYDAVFSYFKTHFEGQSTPTHITVIYKGHIFSVDVLNKDYAQFSTANIKHQLKEIMISVDHCKDDSSIGVFTSLDRSTWSQIRVQLMDIGDNNRTNLEEIERSMFVLSLDHMNVSDIGILSHEAVFADGCNRWYDKCLNFYIFRNGLVTVNVNSTLVDGPIAAFLLHYMHLRIMEDEEKWDDEVLVSISKHFIGPSHTGSIINDILSKVRSRSSVISDLAVNKNEETANPKISDELKGIPRPLIFDLNENLEKELEIAKVAFAEVAMTFSTAVCKFDGYDSHLFLDKDINTDAFAHLVMHLTFFRMYYRMASLGSKTSLMRFHHGRYALMRSTTMEALDWCKTMLDPGTKIAERRDNFWRAIHKHKQLLKESSSGRGFDNHFAALKIIAEEMNLESLPMFVDDIFHLTGDRFDIYSESLGVGCTSGVVVLPRNPKGYGVGYVVAKSRILFYVSSLSDEPTSSADLFAASLEYTLTNLKDFLNRL